MENAGASAHRTVSFKLGGQLVTFRAPTREHWDEHQKKLRSPKHTMSGSIREVCQQCLVEPELEKFQKLFAQKPAFPAVCAHQLGILAGKELVPFFPSEDTCALETDVGRWVFATPSLETWEDFQEQVGGRTSRQREDVMRELCVRCALDPKGLQTLWDSYPAAQNPLTDAIGTLAGADVQVEVKKD